MVKWGTKENHAIEKAVYEGSADDVRALMGLMARTFGPARIAGGLLQRLNPLAAA